MSRQSQAGGDQSHLVQAGRDVHYHGVSAADVVAITRDEVQRALENFRASAWETARERGEHFELRIASRFAEEPKLREAFADPDFQFGLQDAMRARMSNDDEHTEDLLVDLLARRAEEGNSSRARLVTSQAVRAADKLSSEMLTGLTALWALSALSPAEPTWEALTASKAATHRKLLQLGLPVGRGWLDDLELLGLVKITEGMQTRIRYVDFCANQTPVALKPGLASDDPDWTLDALMVIDRHFASALAPHGLCPGSYILPGTDQDDAHARIPLGLRGLPAVAFALEKQYGGTQSSECRQAFDHRLAREDGFAEVRDWWDALPASQFTSTGRAIGFVNARRHIYFTGAASLSDLLD